MTIEKKLCGVNELLQDDNISIEMQDMFKNNVSKKGLVIHMKNCNVSPIMYPDETFWMKPEEEIVVEIKGVCEKHSYHLDNFDFMQKKNILEKVMPRVYSADNLPEIEKKRYVYTRKFDMLILYYVPFDDPVDAGSIATITISNDILQRVGVTVEELHRAALTNLDRNYKIMDMKDMFAIDIPDDGFPKKIVTVQNFCQGAATMFSRQVMLELEAEIGDYFAILPSSVHEIIVVPIKNYCDMQDFLKMVIEVNAGCVAPEDKLTDSVYFWRYGKLNMYVPD